MRLVLLVIINSLKIKKKTVWSNQVFLSTMLCYNRTDNDPLWEHCSSWFKEGTNWDVNGRPLWQWCEHGCKDMMSKSVQKQNFHIANHLASLEN